MIAVTSWFMKCGLLTGHINLMTFKYHQRHLADTQKQTHLQGTQNPSQSQLCKRICFFANASGTHPTTLDTVFNLTHHEEGRTHNRGFAKIRADTCYLRHL